MYTLSVDRRLFFEKKGAITFFLQKCENQKFIFQKAISERLRNKLWASVHDRKIMKLQIHQEIFEKIKTAMRLFFGKEGVETFFEKSKGS